MVPFPLSDTLGRWFFVVDVTQGHESFFLQIIDKAVAMQILDKYLSPIDYSNKKERTVLRISLSWEGGRGEGGPCPESGFYLFSPFFLSYGCYVKGFDVGVTKHYKNHLHSHAVSYPVLTTSLPFPC